MSLDPELYEELLLLAGRHSRRRCEAEELAHDVIAEALSRGLTDWERTALWRWLRGALRRRAAFLARSAVRRRRREERYGVELVAESGSVPDKGRASAPEHPSQHLRSLPPSLRSVAVLLAAGMSRQELSYVLGINDVALRQRISKLRKLWPIAGLQGNEPEDTGLAWGLLRQSLRAILRQDPRLVLGASDPDGHLLLFRPIGGEAKKIDGPELTNEALAATREHRTLASTAPKKRTPC